MRAAVRCLAASGAVILAAGAAGAQQAASPEQTVAQAAPVTELPPVVVTTPSPVAKPKTPKSTFAAPKPAPSKPQAAKAKKTPAGAASAGPPPSDLPPPATLPGTVVAAEDAFVSVTVAGEREILAHQGHTLTDTLMTKPGISGSTFAAGSNRPIVRGLDNYRVRIQENGIGTHDVSALSEDHAVPLDPFAADRIEVVRGPATLRYGSQAIGGVVAAENGRIPEAVPVHGFAATTLGGLSSVDSGADGAFKVTAGAQGVAVHADGWKRDSRDYATPQGRERNTWVNSEGASAGLSRVWDTGFLGVAFVRLDSLYGIPGEEEALARSRINLDHEKLLSKGEWRVGGSGIEAVRFWFGASDYRHDEIANDEDTGTARVGSRFKNSEAEGRAELQHVPVGTVLGELRGAAGIHWDSRRTRGQSFEGDSLLEPAETDSVAAFLFEELEVTPVLRFQAAARIEETDVSGAARRDPLNAEAPVVAIGRRFHPLSASLGVLYELPLGVVARLSGQYVERAPDAAELFSKGVHEATRTFEIGDPGLSREKARTVEFGLKRAKGDVRFDASAYYTRFDGFIFKRLTGVGCGDFLADCGEDDELDQVLFSQRDAMFYGAELGAEWDVAPIWRGVWGLDGRFDI